MFLESEVAEGLETCRHCSGESGTDVVNTGKWMSPSLQILKITLLFASSVLKEDEIG